MAGLAASRPQTEARVLTLFRDEAARWTEALKTSDLTVKRSFPDGSTDEVKGKPSLVTKDPAQAIPGADVIIFCVPAFAHQQYFTAIAPHVQPDTAIIGLPGQPGFEFQCFDILKDKAKRCAILNFETLPWACRITEFGKKVEVLGTKISLTGSKITGQSQLKFDPFQTLESLLKGQPKLKQANNYIEICLMAYIVHPPIIYARWKDWDGKPVSEKPLFYQGLDDFGGECLKKVSDENVKIARVVEQKKPELKQSNVLDLLDWYKQDYAETISDFSSIKTAMRTNTAYNGLVHPMKDAGDGKWVPDFHNRYLSEDIPFSLVITKGLAELAAVPTPEIDKVLAWCQEKLGKEYIVGSELKGKDLKESRAPQAYGFKSLDDLVNLL
nr:hypothetical protein BaRGS_023464 [Batillaria attramentaria]